MSSYDYWNEMSTSNLLQTKVPFLDQQYFCIYGILYCHVNYWTSIFSLCSDITAELTQLMLLFKQLLKVRHCIIEEALFLGTIQNSYNLSTFSV